jgi:hypothetical protein
VRFVSQAKALLVTLAIPLVAAGCGSESPNSASNYRAAAEAACRADTSALSQLPRLQRTEHMTVAELKAVVARARARFRSSVRALTPPSALAAAHRRLLADVSMYGPATVTTRTQLAKAIAHDRRLLADYRSLGLGGCAASLQTQLNRLEHAHPHLPA